jgi:hypothetical protein
MTYSLIFEAVSLKRVYIYISAKQYSRLTSLILKPILKIYLKSGNRPAFFVFQKKQKKEKQKQNKNIIYTDYFSLDEIQRFL